MILVDPFSQRDELWLGDTPGTIRKVFRCIDSRSSQHFCAGITIFAPNEGTIFHNHPVSEEINYVISGSGVLFDADGNVAFRFKKGDIMLSTEGELHRHYNDGTEPLILLWIYSPQTSIPGC